MNAFRVVVGDIVAEETAQVTFIEHDHVIDDLSHRKVPTQREDGAFPLETDQPTSFQSGP